MTESRIKIGVVSDLHLYQKTTAVKRALSKLRGIDLLLIVGDIADRAEEKQYDIFLGLVAEYLGDLPVYCVSGNHDDPLRDDTNYRNFEIRLNGEYQSIVHESGAFYKQISDRVDLIGLNPVYHQKQFFFVNKGLQLTFLQERIAKSSCKYHIVMCHPPLIAHNPQRSEDVSPYIAAEQDKRLQKLIDDTGNVIFISGHTHVSPVVEFDEYFNNLYINDGSICPVTLKNSDGMVQQGNVSLLEISEDEITVIVKGIYQKEGELWSKTVKL